MYSNSLISFHYITIRLFWFLIKSILFIILLMSGVIWLSFVSISFMDGTTSWFLFVVEQNFLIRCLTPITSSIHNVFIPSHYCTIQNTAVRIQHSSNILPTQNTFHSSIVWISYPAKLFGYPESLIVICGFISIKD